MSRYAIPVIILLVLGGFFLRGLGLNPTYIESPLIGKPAPEFSLPDLIDPSANVSTSDLVGQFTLLNVWGTWCPECRNEHDFLLSLARSGMPIYGLNWKDERDKALEWLEVLGDPYVASAADVIGDVAIDFGVYGAPETFLIGPDLTVLQKHISPLTPEVWETRFVPLIEEHSGKR